MQQVNGKENAVVDQDRDRLKGVSRRVHSALRKLKMGESATIAYDKEYPLEDVRNYLIAYALHKGKWFKTRTDETTHIIYATRAAPPPWDHKQEEEDPDEP